MGLGFNGILGGAMQGGATQAISQIDTDQAQQNKIQYAQVQSQLDTQREAAQAQLAAQLAPQTAAATAIATASPDVTNARNAAYASTYAASTAAQADPTNLKNEQAIANNKDFTLGPGQMNFNPDGTVRATNTNMTAADARVAVGTSGRTNAAAKFSQQEYDTAQTQAEKWGESNIIDPMSSKPVAAGGVIIGNVFSALSDNGVNPRQARAQAQQIASSVYADAQAILADPNEQSKFRAHFKLPDDARLDANRVMTLLSRNISVGNGSGGSPAPAPATPTVSAAPLTGNAALIAAAPPGGWTQPANATPAAPGAPSQSLDAMAAAAAPQPAAPAQAVPSSLSRVFGNMTPQDAAAALAAQGPQ